MKIIQLVPELNEGGVERGVVEFNKELVKRGYKSIVISNGGKLVEQIINDGGEHIEFDVCSKNIFSAFSRVKKLKKIFKSIKPDIIHARSRVPAWLSYFAKDKFHFITTVHGFYSVNKYSEIMTKGERVICVSNPIREYVLKNYSVDEKKLRVIFRGVDFERFDIKKINKDFLIKFKNKWNLNNKFIISSVGRITQLKNYETIIKALSLLDERYVLLIVGGVREDKKNYFNYLKNLVKNLNLENRVFFTGSISNIAEIYYLSDVVVSASKKPESFGRSLVEAMALNTPVIAANHGGSLDIIPSKDMLFNPNDYKELANKILNVKKAFDYVNYVKNKFSLKMMSKKIIDVYKEVLEK